MAFGEGAGKRLLSGEGGGMEFRKFSVIFFLVRFHPCSKQHNDLLDGSAGVRKVQKTPFGRNLSP